MLEYLHGFNNHFSSETIENSLPKTQNSPQRAPFGLYAEQISGSAFTMPRAHNLKTWVYRIHPSVKHGTFKLIKKPINLYSTPFNHPCPPNQMRWNPLPIPQHATDFIDGINTMAGNGDISSLTGAATHIYVANKSMTRYFYNADGEMLIVPQHGQLLIKTELGELEVEPLEIVTLPRGIKFQVILKDEIAYGYICENYGAPFRLPELGPIGANGLANPRDFLSPMAKFEDINGDFELVCKFEGELWSATVNHSPFDVVAWHGNYVPYKYDLRKFNTIGTVSFDHPDPSIFTVLTSPTNTPGLANIDFAIFPPRWMVAENTFRPPYFHRNLMSEFMGLIRGQYDAKPDGFIAGGSSLHNRFAAHGPDADACKVAIERELKPIHLANTMAFMFESSNTWRVTPFALETPSLQPNYLDCWQAIEKSFLNITT